jgi:hypothetical protein
MRGVGGDIDSEFALKKHCVDKTESFRGEKVDIEARRLCAPASQVCASLPHKPDFIQRLSNLT